MQRIEFFSQRIGRLTGWRRNALAFACGTLMTWALAPWFIFPLIVPSFTGLVWLVSGARSRRRAFWDGWWWGWGFYITGLYWICIALLTDAEKFAWLIPFMLFGITGLIALFSGAACWLTAASGERGLRRIYLFSVIWALVEFLRGAVIGDFPWNLPGYSFAFSDAALQMASLVGVYGLTWFAVLLGASFAALSERRGLMFVVAVWGAFAIGMGWGGWRVASHDANLAVPGVRLRLVQANIAQEVKWDPVVKMQGMREYIRMTQAPGLEGITHVLWPETATPYAVADDTSPARFLGGSVPPGEYLITGSLRVEGDDKDWQIWNSMADISHAGHVVGVYDKHKLVPFGEFVPLRALLPASWLTPVGDKDFSRGPGPQTLNWPGLPSVSPLICYEAIFPGMAVGNVRPNWLLNITNDAWFGLSTGPYQHFTMARTRAVEQGLPLVRVANTGISAVVDGFGRVIASLPLGSAGVLDSGLPPAQNDTVFSFWHEWFLGLLSFSIIMLWVRQPKAEDN